MRLSGPHGTLGLDAGIARAVSLTDAATTVPATLAAPFRKLRRSIGEAAKPSLFAFVDSDIGILRFSLSQHNWYLFSGLLD
jgi:hypothetical protein